MLNSLSPIYKFSLQFAGITAIICTLITYTEPLNKKEDTQIKARTPDEVFSGVFNRLFPGTWHNNFKGEKSKDVMSFMNV